MLWALFGLPDNALGILGVGAIAIFVGIFIIGPVLARPISRFIGAPLPKVRGMTGTLARENAIRNPRRTAATASALMIGVALVGFITIFAASAKASISSTLDAQMRTDYIVTSGSGIGFALLPPAVAEGMAALPELGAVSAVRYATMELGGSARVRDRARYVGGRPARRPRYRARRARGPHRRRHRDQQQVRVDNSLAIGDVAADHVPQRHRHRDGPSDLPGSQLGVSGDFVISIESFDAHFLPSQRLDVLVLATLAPGVTAADGRAAIEHGHQAVPDRHLRDNAEYKKTQEAAIDTVVNLVYALLVPGGVHRADRHREHARAVDLRAHPRARVAARGRHEPLPRCAPRSGGSR